MAAALAMLAILLLAAELFVLRWFATPEARLADCFVRRHAVEQRADPGIVIVDIDDASLALMQDAAGLWPWPREIFADLLISLNRFAPRDRFRRRICRTRSLASEKRCAPVGCSQGNAECVSCGDAQAQAALLNVGRKLYASGLDQGDEFEADRLAVVIAARAGYDPYGLPAVLQLLQSQSPSGGDFALLFATHPPPDARISTMGKAMDGRFDNLASNAGQTIAVRVREFHGK